jgi:hypothetical protein
MHFISVGSWSSTSFGYVSLTLNCISAPAKNWSGTKVSVPRFNLRLVNSVSVIPRGIGLYSGCSIVPIFQSALLEVILTPTCLFRACFNAISDHFKWRLSFSDKFPCSQCYCWRVVFHKRWFFEWKQLWNPSLNGTMWLYLHKPL